MAQAVSISEQIFKRWYEKLRNDNTVPQALLKELELLHQQRKLSDAEAIGELLRQVEGTDDGKD
jgi:hypothetical protein